MSIEVVELIILIFEVTDELRTADLPIRSFCDSSVLCWRFFFFMLPVN